MAWSEDLCTTVKRVDELRQGIDKVTGEKDPVFAGSYADSYAEGVPHDVDEALTGLKDLKPSGVKPADAAVADLVKALGDVGPQLPPPDPAGRNASDQQKIAHAKQIAAIIAKVPAAAPKMAGVVTHEAKLAASYNLAPDCAPVHQANRPAPHAPTRAMVAWSDTMCTTASALTSLASGPPPTDSPDPRFAQFDAPILAQYLETARSQTEGLMGPIAILPPTGVKAADDYSAKLVTGLRAALGRLPKYSPGSSLSDAPLDELKQEAAQVAATLTPLKPSTDPATVAATDPALNASYGLAPHCTPPAPPKGPSPQARNGTDYGACAGGTCQVQVSGQADLMVAALEIRVQVAGSRITLTEGTGGMQLGSGGDASFGQGGGKGVKIHVTSADGTTAVLDISPA